MALTDQTVGASAQLPSAWTGIVQFNYADLAPTTGADAIVDPIYVKGWGLGPMYIADGELTDPRALTDFLSFAHRNQTGAAVINDTLHTIVMEVATGTDLDNFYPVWSVDLGAHVEKGKNRFESGSRFDVSSPLSLRCVAEDGTVQVWLITVTTP